ncbi:MAG: lipoyl(octanoyl) transferase LipB [Ignavibacteriaceae bacterium]|nr:lipoyl(octanoyl) transferase LipB [Ignavibacteria bacterium]NUM63034.1 lipoyl(octanoyl) transferase LipB [Ignavibacteriaceae bacterium]
MKNKILTYCDLGFIDYKEAWDLQHEIHTKRVSNEVEDFLFLLEHPNTYTLGKTAHKENLVGSENYLRENQISVYDIDRGGDITYHGPGQIVGYPIIDLNRWHNDTHKYLRALEEVIIKTCSEFGLDCERNEKHTGVWLADRKIAAIGIKVSRWVTMHGFAFNVNTDLNLFNGIIPCGIQDKSVTSLKKELGKEISVAEVKEKILKNFFDLFSYDELASLKKQELFQTKFSLTN